MQDGFTAEEEEQIRNEIISYSRPATHTPCKKMYFPHFDQLHILHNLRESDPKWNTYDKERVLKSIRRLYPRERPSNELDLSSIRRVLDFGQYADENFSTINSRRPILSILPQADSDSNPFLETITASQKLSLPELHKTPEKKVKVEITTTPESFDDRINSDLFFTSPRFSARIKGRLAEAPASKTPDHDAANANPFSSPRYSARIQNRRARSNPVTLTGASRKRLDFNPEKRITKKTPVKKTKKLVKAASNSKSDNNQQVSSDKKSAKVSADTQQDELNSKSTASCTQKQKRQFIYVTPRMPSARIASRLSIR